jgi:hypothetical protein
MRPFRNIVSANFPATVINDPGHPIAKTCGMGYLAAINRLVDDSRAGDESAGGVSRRKILLAARVSKFPIPEIPVSVVRLVVHAMPALGNENRPLERHELRPVGFLAERPD